MSQPVFVDGSGRRARWFARVCWGLGTLGCVYIALVVVALVAPPGAVSLGLGPLLPKPQAPALTDSTGARVLPRDAIEHPVSGRSAAPGQVRSSQPGNQTPGVLPTTAQGSKPSHGPVASPAPVPTGPGRSSDHPTPKPHPTSRTTPPGRP